MTTQNKFSRLSTAIQVIGRFIPTGFFGRRTQVATASAVVLSFLAFGAVGSVPQAPDDMPHVVRVREDLLVYGLEKQLERIRQTRQHFVSEGQMRPGDTLAALLSRMGVDDSEASGWLRTDKAAAPLLKVPDGTIFQADTDGHGRLLSLRVPLKLDIDDIRPTSIDLLVRRQGSRFVASTESADLETRIEMRSGTIKSTLFAATDDANVPDEVAGQMLDMFGAKIDFTAGLRPGDHFNLAYETFWEDGREVGAGKILAGEFVNGGEKFRAVWFDGQPGASGGYYDIDGTPLAKAFLKAPLATTRISSGFSMRMHPILGVWKQHTGTDFAAPMGTPIHATSDGVISERGWQNGYGNVIFLKRDSQYTTVYGHMSRFANGIHEGSIVKQGDVIGYVGMTGWATGPHVHYEVRINDRPYDPMTVTLPGQEQLASRDLKKFMPIAEEVKHRFALLDGVEERSSDTTAVASTSEIISDAWKRGWTGRSNAPVSPENGNVASSRSPGTTGRSAASPERTLALASASASAGTGSGSGSARPLHAAASGTVTALPHNIHIQYGDELSDQPVRFTPKSLSNLK